MAAVGAWAEELYFSRAFPGSEPAYFDVTVRSDGSADYREATAEEPLEFAVDEATVRMLWERTEAMDRFAKPVSSKRKVAFTGDKVLRLTADDGQVSELKFTYTENAEAQEIVAWFLKVGETARHRIDLDRALQFDRLGVNDALLRLQSSFDRDRVVAPSLVLPVLLQIVEQQRILHLARARASAMVERIQAGALVNNE